MASTISPAVYDSSLRSVALGRELGRGGEGAVYEVVSSSYVAKIYHKPPDREQAEKISAMVQLRDDRLLALSTWPVGTLCDTRGALVGMLMPRLSAYREIHELYRPQSRLQEFPPRANWAFLVHTAANVARAFEVIHGHGHVIGDVNQKNILASDEATVKLVDCDSFQIQAKGRVFPCNVGFQEFQPPELQSLPSFRGFVRTPNHDNFGLAVMIFQLLFLGRHPFAGRFLGSGDMLIDRAIREHRFAYGNAALRGMAQPPNTPSLDIVSAPVARLFDRAFSPAGDAPGARPTPREWIDRLSELSAGLKSCSLNSGHVFFRELRSCPWCEVERAAGISYLFISVALSGGRPEDNFNLETVWAQIATVKPPGPASDLPDPTLIPVQASGKFQELGALRRTRLHWGVGFSVLLCVAALALMPIIPAGGLFILVLALTLPVVVVHVGFIEGQRKARSAVADAELVWAELNTQWSRECGEDGFWRTMKDLEGARRQLDSLDKDREWRLRKLEAERRLAQLHAYLSGYRLADARNIPNVGAKRKATLRAWGIETAADVTDNAVRQVPGFGGTGKYRSYLLGWRRDLENKFVFDPKRGVEPAARAAVERDTFVAKQPVQRKLLQGKADLTRVAEDIRAKRGSVAPKAPEAAQRLAQARADLQALSLKW